MTDANNNPIQPTAYYTNFGGKWYPSASGVIGSVISGDTPTYSPLATGATGTVNPTQNDLAAIQAGLGATTAQQNNEAALTWSQLMGQVIASGTLPPVGSPTLAAQQAVGNVSINGKPTPTVEEQTLSGLLNNGSPTLPSQIATGYINGNATTTEQQIQQQTINDILAANTSPANAFSYLAKLQGIQNSGALANIMRGALQGATGQSLSQLQSQPNISNISMLSSLLSGAQPNMPNVGGSQGLANAGALMQYLGSLGLTGNGITNTIGATSTNLGGAGAQTSNSASHDATTNLISQLISALHQSQPANTVQPPNGNNNFVQNLQAATAGTNLQTSKPAENPNLPTGWASSQQQYNKLVSPSLQGALTNYVATAGGEQPNDFLAGLAAASPEFTKAANAKVGTMGNF